MVDYVFDGEEMMMTDGHPPHEEISPDRRAADRQISVLINAAILHQGHDALCRIRNLSSGGVMIECNLPLAVDDLVSLRLKSGHEVGGLVRWVSEGKAGIAFNDPASAMLVGGAVAVPETMPPSPIGYPLFRRNALVKLCVGHRREQVVMAMISPTGIIVESGMDWGAERLFTVCIDDLGDHVARKSDAVSDDEEGAMALVFVQPLHYRAFNDWLASVPSAEASVAEVVDGAMENRHWV
ncbi:MAG: PilZ domain-containing protein [Sphingomonadales bacterium]|nr:MAG: PilZ domain-containing protein [Sphingomonadales bacterium]TNF06289.1 MAG: PilZ domain-containing protein [Sphingomonadales bacterium]